ncbi:MAG: metallophosphoesterase [Bacteroidales bacterium]|jgi:predicted MPP superfamily phosphohydrolase|nr:metallophosphoesterase [Bacteroidales bacterium]
MKKIIHLSDLHVGHKDCGEKFMAIIENISSLSQPPSDYVIVITGDIVDNANHARQTDEALKGIMLLKEKGYTVLPVPGNHDYGSGVRGKYRYVGIFKERYFGNRELTYPRLDIIDETAFIGLDSTAEELKGVDRFLSEGELGTDQLERLEKILGSKDVEGKQKVVYLHHHPFDYKPAMHLKDSYSLRMVIENRIDLLLFGHYHVDPISAGKIYHGTWGISRCYNAGSSTHKNGNTGFQRVIDLSDPDPAVDYDGNFI